ncbi:MAG: bifunctional UDP-3-O-[3-hydroxymyristoyl] N-acetylglucosamine deacetylase/3-hydroxyacyl-ACP dehydratase [Candidatus Krumholzibacteria bacterium]|nr:bifunctional UDP-3-O-[3-hydroxymyristoyl] N-acetylglucosamine deacetylase/3-hydroxyacyl-ACP dehydratase [Candidatus Krumholzibacteria bacterium]
MIRQQRTIKGSFVYEGIGLHTGKPVRTVFHPAPPSTGVRFRRVDLSPAVEIPASVDFISAEEIRRNTTLENKEAVVHTVEHILASASGLQIDNMIVDIDSDEPPEPRDGSCTPLVEALQKVGFENQGVPVRFLKITKPVVFAQDGIELYALPYKGFKLSFTIDYKNPHIGIQYASFDVTPELFVSEIAPARTFVLWSDVELLKSQGLIKGGSLDNAIAVDAKGIVNNVSLRFANEFVRHKILDLVGDLTLVGAPIEGHIIAIRSGHRFNLKFARLLAQELKNQQRTSGADKRGIWDINAIQTIMPHRYPFLLVDRILTLEDKKRVVGIKNVTINEPFFMGHFPGHPIMPAVLIIEAMGQVGGILLLSAVDAPEKYLVYFIGIDKARFRKPVVPGDQVRFELEMITLRKRFCKMKGVAYVDDQVVAEAELFSSIIDR